MFWRIRTTPSSLLRFVLAFAFLLGAGAQAHAQSCGTPSLGELVYTADGTGGGTLTFQYSFPSASSGNYLQLWVNGSHQLTTHPSAQSGTGSFVLNTRCWKTGTYTVTVLAVSCGLWQEEQYKAYASMSIEADSSPDIGTPVFTPDASGNGTLTATYAFPYLHAQNYIQLWVDGEARAPWYPDQQSGTFSTSLSIACWSPGAHTVTLLAVTCGNWSGDAFKDAGTTTVTVQPPQLSGAAFDPGTSGDGTLSVDYTFATHDPDNYVQLWRGNDILSTYYPSTRSGAHTFPVNTVCWPSGAHTLNVLAVSCGKYADPAFKTQLPVTVTLDHRPSAALTIRPKPGNPAIYQAVVNHHFPNTATAQQRHLRLEWTDDGSVVSEVHPEQMTGQWIVDLPACAPRDKTMVRVIATTCSGETDFDEAPAELPECAVSCSVECPDCVGDPIRVTSGNMRLSDSDPLPAGDLGALGRTYDSTHPAGAFGTGWSSIFDAKATFYGGSSNRRTVHLVTERGDSSVFVNDGGSGTAYLQIFPAGERRPATLAYDAARNVFVQRAADSMVRIFSGATGRLIGARNQAHLDETTIAWDADGRPAAVTDAHGRWSWTISTDASGRITTVSVDGEPQMVWTYSYDSAGRLTTVSHPGGTWRTYTYVNGFMTEARDGVGHLLESHEYDSSGNASTSHGPSGEITSIEYGLAGRVSGETVTRVTFASGKTTSYYSRYIAGKMRTVQVGGSCDCGTEDTVFAYDATGHIIREQNAAGYVTVRVFDGARMIEERTDLRPAACDPATDATQCRLTPDDLAAALLTATDATTSRSYSYADPNWPDRATLIGTTSVVEPGESRIERFSYHAVLGEVTTHTISAWTIAERPPDRDGDGGTTIGPLLVDRTTKTTFYGDVPPCTDDGRPEGEPCSTEPDFTPAFDPGGSFQSAWLTLPQPAYRRKSVDGPRTDVSDVTSFVHYPLDASVPAVLRGRLAAVRNAAGHIMRYEQYDVFGNPTRIVDPNGVATEMTYDALGRVVTSTLKGVAGCDTTSDPLCATDLTTTRTYYGSGPVDTETRADGSVTKYTYDTRSRVITISRGPAAGDLRERIEYTYDPVTGEKLLERTLAYESGGWVEKRRQSFAYDAEGRLETVTHADGASIAYTYDVDGRIASMRDENHVSPNTFYAYDPAGRLTTVTQALSGGSITTHYAYDVHGNLTSVTDPNGNVTSYTFDDFGAMVSQSSSVTGVTSYRYDSAGNLISTIDANGATTTRTYDALGRVVATTSVLGTNSESITWTYDIADTGSTGDGSSFPIGRLGRMADPTGSTSYGYDRRGLLTAEAKTIGSATYVTGFAHDATGNRTRIDYPSGAAVTFGFDHAGRPIAASRAGVPLVTSATYLPFGPATEIVYGNGTTRRRSHDQRYRLVTNTFEAAGRAVASYAYTHDLAGNITRIDDLIDASWNRAYGYDDLNRLIAADGPWGPGSFAYDAMGNMTSRVVGEGRSATFTYQTTTPQIATVSESSTNRTVVYDAAGNEIAIRTLGYDPRNGTEIVLSESLYGYSSRNSLAHQNALTYMYDGRGIRTTVVHPVRIASLSIGPSTIDGGASAVGTVALTEPAPAGGAVVLLTSNHAAVIVPASVRIAGGELSATFSVATQTVSEQTSAVITATFNGSRSVGVTIVPPLVIAEMSTSRTTLVSGESVTGAIMLATPAPESGAVIALSSSHAAVTVPEQIVIGSGREFGQFTIATTSVTSTVTATITATLGTSAAEVTITVVPLTVSLAFSSPMYGGLPATGTVTLNGAAPAGGATVMLSTAYGGIAIPPSVIVAEGVQSATFDVTAAPVEEEIAFEVRAAYGTAEGWTTVKIVPPILTDFTVTPATIVGSEPLAAAVTINAPAAEEGADVPIASTHPDLVGAARATVPSGETTGTIELTTNWVAETTPVIVSATRHGVTRSTTVTLEPPPVTLSSFTITPTSLVGTNDATGTVVLTGAALEGGLEIELASSNREVAAPPASVIVPSGAAQASFAIPTALGGSPTSVTISAWHATTIQMVTLTVEPPAGNYVAALDVKPAFIAGGTSASGTVALAAAATGSGADVLLESSDPLVLTVPPSVRVLPNKTTAAFSVTTTAVTAPVAVTVTARHGGVMQRRKIIVAPANVVTVSSLSITPDRVASESTTTGLIVLTGAAPYGGADVTIEPNRRNIITVPSVVTVPEGATSATFAIVADRLNASRERSVDVTATYNGISATATMTVLPKPVAAITPHPIMLCASLAIAPCVTTTALDLVAQGVQDEDPAPATGRQHFLYTPELNLFAETAPSTATTPPIAWEYIWFAGEPLAQANATTGEIHYYLTDHLGTPMLQTDASASIIWQAEYEPYGEIHALRHGESKHQPLRFPGQEAREGGDTAYNIFRWYRPAWGKYTQADPLAELRASEPNLYLYARARPITLIDPFGLWAVDKSCDCNSGGYSFGGKKKVEEGVDVACNKFLKKPNCASFIEHLTFAKTMDGKSQEALGPCMRRLCDSDKKIYCAQNSNPQAPGACAKANPGGALTLMRGAGTSDCYFDQGGGWSHTIFHEMVHVCGLTEEGSESYETGPLSKLFQKIMWTCAGVPY